LVRFLDRLYTELDALVDRHGLEKVKTSGDSYMVVSGLPQPRTDHVEALACLALEIADAVSDLKDPQGREVPLRIGLAAGPVVAGVVGARKFFYDVWGNAVNVASRMETTDVEGQIQVPPRRAPGCHVRRRAAPHRRHDARPGTRFASSPCP
jgi:adenylate cyclase